MTVLERQLEQWFAACSGRCVGPARRENARYRRAGMRVITPRRDARFLVELSDSPSETPSSQGSSAEIPSAEILSAEIPSGEIPRDEVPRDGALTPPGIPETGSTTAESPTSAEDDAEMRLRRALADVGVASGLVDDLTKASLACAAVDAGSDPDVHEADGAAALTSAPDHKARAQEMLAAVEQVTVLSSRMDGVRLAATRQLTAQVTKMLLAEKGMTDPDEMSKTARKALLIQAKRSTRHEIEAVTGWGSGDVTKLVGLANAPASVRGPVHQSLAKGEASWPVVRAYFRSTSAMEHEDGAAIANGLFGDDPDESVTERLTREGEFVGGPWRAKEFYRALEREVHKIKNQDPEEAKKAKARAKAGADVRVNIDLEGTAEILIGTRPAHATAAADRIERAARAARKAGDKRTLRELRVAVAMSLLLHGTLDFDGISDDPNTLTVEQSDQLTKILYALPAANLQVIVPFGAIFGDTLPGMGSTGSPLGSHGVNDAPDVAADLGGEVTTGLVGGPAAAPPGPAEPSTPGTRGDPCPTPPASQGRTPPASQGRTPPASQDSVRPNAVGEVIGKRPTFLNSSELWELMLTPGSAFYRLLVDPVTGRCVEKSAKGYRFTAAQREQIMAADGFCRAPGCLQPAWLCQIDHVQEYGTPGGDTSEANAQSVNDQHHNLKTMKLWDAVINKHRDVTWTTLLGRIYTTKAHDYTQYTKLLTAATQFVNAPEGPDTTTGVAPDRTDRQAGVCAGQEESHTGDDCADQDRADRVDEVIYRALSYRFAGEELLRDDDWSEDEAAFYGWPLITLTHRNANGRRVFEPDPATLAEARRARSAASEGEGPTTDRDAALLDGIDLSQAVDLSTIDESRPAATAPEVEASDPFGPSDSFGPSRFPVWDTTDDSEPPF